MTKKDEEHYRNTIICRFCKENIRSKKVRDQGQLTSRYRGSAHNTCNRNVTQKQGNFLPYVFHNFSNYDRHFVNSYLIKRMIK